MKKHVTVAVLAAATLSILFAQDTTSRALPPFSVPSTVEVRNVDIYSEGARMAGQIYISKANAGKKLPTLVLAQGWGGTMQSLPREGVAFAQAGYLVVWTPQVQVIHPGNLPDAPHALEALREKWAGPFQHDLAYNKNLALTGKGFTLGDASSVNWLQLLA